jgi:protein TonB
MAGSHPQFHRFGLAATVALHGALAAALLRTGDVPSVAAPLMVSLIDSAGQERVPAPPRPLVQPRPAQETPPPKKAEMATERAAAAPADEAPAPESAIVLSRLDADYLNNPRPAYPTLSRRLGEEGRVLLRVLVRADGTPAEVTLHQSSGYARLDQAALEAVRKWRFTVRRGGAAVAAPVLVPISFILKEA